MRGLILSLLTLAVTMTMVALQPSSFKIEDGVIPPPGRYMSADNHGKNGKGWYLHKVDGLHRVTSNPAYFEGIPACPDQSVEAMKAWEFVVLTNGDWAWRRLGP